MCGVDVLDFFTEIHCKTDDNCAEMGFNKKCIKCNENYLNIDGECIDVTGIDSYENCIDAH